MQTAPNTLWQSIPVQRLKPIDGLVITASVWEEAHEYHRLRQRAHELLAHGCGILTGLEVVASDPPDTTVYIRPGAAIDPHGELIVVPHPLAYDFGQAQGDLHLLLTYAEREVGAVPSTSGETDPLRVYIHTGYQVEACVGLPAGAHIELARVRRYNRQAPIFNATVPAHPGLNEIDLRSRHMVKTSTRHTAGIAVCYVADEPLKDAVRADRLAGVDALVRFACATASTDFWADDDVLLTAPLDQYALVYLNVIGPARLSTEEMNGLYAYLRQGGTVLMESCRHRGDGAAGHSMLLDALASLGIQPLEVQAGHPLLGDPWMFATVPAGYADGSGRLLVGDGVILSECDYGNVWCGTRQGRPATREEIRAAHELGVNILTYALRRKQASEKAFATPIPKGSV
ncbi:MAG: DUF4159 domain-containing protein [Anaerolineae bacterium]|nr:DUF4159 domain-containing protein [Thermoflexales bacterium]MDW8406738.1 DUF4159 domain-containing protein [Anaerolineae bacterium]